MTIGESEENEALGHFFDGLFWVGILREGGITTNN